MKRLIMKLGILFALSMFLIACTPAVEPPVPVVNETAPPVREFLNGGYAEVNITGFTFTPKNITVYQGDRVKWINSMPFVKSIWIWGMDPSPVIRTGKSWSHIFTDIGFFRYRDQFAQDMEGNVTVLPYEERPDIKARLEQERLAEQAESDSAP